MPRISYSLKIFLFIVTRFGPKSDRFGAICPFAPIELEADRAASDTSLLRSADAVVFRLKNCARQDLAPSAAFICRCPLRVGHSPHKQDAPRGRIYVAHFKSCHFKVQHGRRHTLAAASAVFVSTGNKCARQDLNLHALRRQPLKLVCLPIPPLALIQRIKLLKLKFLLQNVAHALRRQPLKLVCLPLSYIKISRSYSLWKAQGLH